MSATETKPPLIWNAGRWNDVLRGAKYRLPIRIFWVGAQDVTVHMAVPQFGGIKPCVSGRATLHNGSSVRFMTDPAQATRDFSLSIHASEPSEKNEEPTDGAWSMLRCFDESQEGSYSDYLQRALKAGAATAALGFSAKDGELGLKDEWYLQIYISAENLAKLVDAVRHNRAHHVTLGVGFINLFLPESDWHKPLAEPVTWYLPPDDLVRPNADGYVKGLSWRETPEHTPPPVSTGNENEATLEPVPVHDPNADKNRDVGAPNYPAIAATHQADLTRASWRIAKALNWIILLLATVIVLLVIHR